MGLDSCKDSSGEDDAAAFAASYGFRGGPNACANQAACADVGSFHPSQIRESGSREGNQGPGYAWLTARQRRPDKTAGETGRKREVMEVDSDKSWEDREE